MIRSARIRYISIPRGLPSYLAGLSRGVRRAFAFLYKLKSLYVGGAVFHFRRRIAAIAQQFGISERTAWTYIGALRSRGLVAYEGHTLRLIGSDALIQQLGLTEQGFHRVFLADLALLEERMAVLALSHNLRKQAYARRHRLVDQALCQAGITHSSSLNASAKARYRRKLRGEIAAVEQASQAQHQTENASLSGNHTGINPDITLSRTGVARVLGYRSKSGAHARIRRLTEKGLLQDRKRTTTVLDYAYSEEWALLTKLGRSPGLRWNRATGEVYRVLANQITPLL